MIDDEKWGQVAVARRGDGETGEGDRKAAILSAAVSLFARRGFRDASLASIAEAAGLTQPGLLHHFPSKQDLLIAVLKVRERGDKERVAATVGEHPNDVVRALEALVSHNEAARDETWLHTVLSAEATAPGHPAHDYFVARYRRVRSALRRSIARQSPGSPDEEDLQALVSVVLAVMDGLQLQWLLDPEIDMVECFRVFARLLDGVISSGRTAKRGVRARGARGRGARRSPD